jgi:hypothetical protein
MANIRIKDLSTTASSTASDDFFGVDGATNGTRKLNAYSPTFGGNLTVSGSSTSNLISLRSTSTSGYAETSFFDAANNRVGAVGFGNSATASPYTSAMYFNTLFSTVPIVFAPNGTAALTLSGTGGNATLAGNLTVSGTTASTSTTTGALVVSGGVGVAGAANFGGAISIGNTVNTVSPTSPNRTITILIGGTPYYIHAKTTND